METRRARPPPFRRASPRAPPRHPHPPQRRPRASEPTLYRARRRSTRSLQVCASGWAALSSRAGPPSGSRLELEGWPAPAPHMRRPSPRPRPHHDLPLALTASVTDPLPHRPPSHTGPAHTGRRGPSVLDRGGKARPTHDVRSRHIPSPPPPIRPPRWPPDPQRAAARSLLGSVAARSRGGAREARQTRHAATRRSARAVVSRMSRS